MESQNKEDRQIETGRDFKREEMERQRGGGGEGQKQMR